MFLLLSHIKLRNAVHLKAGGYDGHTDLVTQHFIIAYAPDQGSILGSCAHHIVGDLGDFIQASGKVFRTRT